MPVRGVGSGGMPLFEKLLVVHEPGNKCVGERELQSRRSHSYHTFLRIVNLHVRLAVAQTVCGLATTKNIKLFAVGAAGRVVHRLGHRNHGVPGVAVRQVDAASD